MICEFQKMDAYGAILHCTENSETSVKQPMSFIAAGQQGFVFHYWCALHREFMIREINRKGGEANLPE